MTTSRSIRWWRWFAGVFAGIIVGFIVGGILGIYAGLLAGWASGAALVVIWVLVVTWPMSGESTREHAQQEDPGRKIARTINLLGSVASLAGVVIVVVQSRSADEAHRGWLAAIVVMAVVASWFLIQIDAMLRYARIYYSDSERPIDFNQEDLPAYADFAYFAFGLGLTYQVADTNVRTTEVRRLVVVQSLIAYLFGAVILATVINLISSLG